jgi:hypothetical protein
VHDRNVDGRTLTFGNQGALYMFNMTWWDHETGSIWVQLTGSAERGDLVGATLEQLPAYTGPWSTWLASHPDTLLLDESRGSFFREVPHGRFVIGIALGDDSSAYYFPDAAAVGVLNDSVGATPVVVYVREDTRTSRYFCGSLTVKRSRSRPSMIFSWTIRPEAPGPPRTGSRWTVRCRAGS